MDFRVRSICGTYTELEVRDMYSIMHSSTLDDVESFSLAMEMITAAEDLLSLSGNTESSNLLNELRQQIEV